MKSSETEKHKDKSKINKKDLKQERSKGKKYYTPTKNYVRGRVEETGCGQHLVG